MTTNETHPVVAQKGDFPIPAQVQHSIDHDAFWILVAQLKEAKPGADYVAKSEALVTYIQKFAKGFSVVEFGKPMTMKEVDDIVYLCRQNGNDTTYAIVNAALAQRSKSEPVAVLATAHRAADLMPGEMVYKVTDVESMRQSKAAALPMRGAICLAKTGRSWVRARFVAADLDGSGAIVQEPGKAPEFVTWDDLQFVRPFPSQATAQFTQGRCLPAMVVTNGESTVHGCDWDGVPPGVYHVYPVPETARIPEALAGAEA